MQHPQPVEYKGVRLDGGYLTDLLVEDKPIIELKNVEQNKGTRSHGNTFPREHVPKGIHEAQLLAYMRLAGVKNGRLIYFNITSGGVVNKTGHYTPQVLFVSFVMKQ